MLKGASAPSGQRSSLSHLSSMSCQVFVQSSGFWADQAKHVADDLRVAALRGNRPQARAPPPCGDRSRRRRPRTCRRRTSRRRGRRRSSSPGPRGPRTCWPRGASPGVMRPMKSDSIWKSMSLAWMLYFGCPDIGALMPRFRLRRAPALACHSSYFESLNISPYCSVVASRPSLSITSAKVIST